MILEKKLDGSTMREKVENLKKQSGAVRGISLGDIRDMTPKGSLAVVSRFNAIAFLSVRGTEATWVYFPTGMHYTGTTDDMDQTFDLIGFLSLESFFVAADGGV